MISYTEVKIVDPDFILKRTLGRIIESMLALNIYFIMQKDYLNLNFLRFINQGNI